MAITLIKQPYQFGRCIDTNRLTYKFSSDNYTEPNFQFQFFLIYWDPAGTEYVNGGYNVIGYFNKFADIDGTVEFNPAEEYINYLGYDFLVDITGLTCCVDACAKYELVAYEFYGEPPVRNYGTRWSDESGTNPPMKLYRGVQQPIPYDYIPLNPQGNDYWVMYANHPYSGHYLIDFSEVLLGDEDFYYLYFLADKTSRPTHIRYKWYYTCQEGGDVVNNIMTAPIGNLLGIQNQLYNQPSLNRPLVTGNNIVTLPTSGETQAIGIDPNAVSFYICTGYTYDTSIEYTNDNSFMYYFPCGPWYLDKVKNYFEDPDKRRSWIYYEIDLLSGVTVMNLEPFRVFRDQSNSCGSKYGKTRLAYMNQHGAFEVFNKFTGKQTNEFSYETKTYKKKMDPFNFSPYEAGERIYGKNISEEITLRTGSITQKEAQSLMNLKASNKVFMIKIYKYGNVYKVYGIPVIVTNKDAIYPDKKKDKEITMEVKIRYSNVIPTLRD